MHLNIQAKNYNKGGVLLRKKRRNNNWDHIVTGEIEEGPFVQRIIFPPPLYKHALKRGAETYKEVGFYLVGHIKKGICYIHDLVEFDYSEQSGGFIESGMARYLRLKAGVPLGLTIVGHIHKHPGFTYYSATDKRNFLQIGNANPLNAFLIYMIEPYKDIKGYTATGTKIFSADVIIRDLTEEEALIEKELQVKFVTKMLLPKKSRLSDIKRIFSENIGSESLKFLSRATIEVNSAEPGISEEAGVEIIPRKAVELKEIGKNKRIQYRVFMEEEETIADLEQILRQLTYIPKEKAYDIIFYERGQKLQRDRKMKEIRNALEWNLEKSVLLPIFQKFYGFWKEFFKIIGRKMEENEGEVEEYAETSMPLSKSLDIETVFRNFNKFWNDIFEIHNKENQEEPSGTSEVEANNSKKQQSSYKRDKLDYFI
jgi:CRISPR/Cas system-associated endoribonuclease Cas2/proteasome lid subunit RPN8/RPN11